VAETLRRLLSARHQRAGFVGLQWDSNIGGANTYVPQFLASLAGLAKNPYLSKVKLARQVGHHAARQLLLALKDRFPKAHLHVLAHSMGCEVAGYMLGARKKIQGDSRPAFAVDRNLGLELLCLAGSDLDSSVFYQSDFDPVSVQYIPVLTWITIPRLLDGEQDDGLALHSIERGQAAMGNSLPRMKESQIDLLIGGFRVYYDTEKIPPKHGWPLYYTSERLSRLVDAVLHLEDPAANPSRDLESLEKVKSLPDSITELRKHLVEPSFAVRLYLIWRMERLTCGGEPVHLADGTLSKLGQLMTRDPNEAGRHLMSSPCAMLRHGFFPTPETWREAREIAKKRARKRGADTP
jgi:hypothetical protein